jgi:uncharacterized membrane protein YvbJ
MVYCHNCGTKNDDESEYCSKCGTPLKDSPDYDEDRRRRRDERYQHRNECFGMPHGNIIGPVIAGVILILIGISAFTSFNFWNYLWPAIIIIVGLIIVGGAIYRSKNN